MLKIYTLSHKSAFSVHKYTDLAQLFRFRTKMHKHTGTISISLTGCQSNYNFHLAGFFMLGASALLKFEIRLEKS